DRERRRIDEIAEQHGELASFGGSRDLQHEGGAASGAEACTLRNRGLTARTQPFEASPALEPTQQWVQHLVSEEWRNKKLACGPKTIRAASGCGLSHNRARAA